jgi:hypothetical protein
MDQVQARARVKKGTTGGFKEQVTGDALESGGKAEY